MQNTVVGVRGGEVDGRPGKNEGAVEIKIQRGKRKEENFIKNMIKMPLNRVFLDYKC